MHEYKSSIKPIEITRSRRKEANQRCTSAELTLFLQLTGKLNFLGHGSLPQASFVASNFQQLVGDLRVKHLTDLNAAHKQISKLSATIFLKSPKESVVL